MANEPVLAFTQGSPERDALQKVREGGGCPLGAGHGTEVASAAPEMLLCACSHCPLLPRPPALGGTLEAGESCTSGGWERLGASCGNRGIGASLEPQSRSGVISPHMFYASKHPSINCQYFKNYEVS